MLKLLEDVIAHNAVIVRDFNRGQFNIVGLAVTSGVNLWTPYHRLPIDRSFRGFAIEVQTIKSYLEDYTNVADLF